MIAIDVEMPKNCRECVLRDIRNTFYHTFQGCPCNLELDERPSNCPLLEVCTLKVTRLAEEDEAKDWTEKFLIHRMGQFVADHPELMQISNSDSGPILPIEVARGSSKSLYTAADEYIKFIKTIRRTEAYLNIVMPEGAKLNEQD